MNKPSASTMLLGHTAVALPGSIITLWLCYEWTQNSAVWWLAAIMLFVMYHVANANGERTRYLKWKEAWDGMAAPGQPKPPKAPTKAGGWRPWAGCTLLAALGIYFAANAEDSAYAGALIWLLLIVAIVGIVALKRQRSKGGGSSPRTTPVSICVKAPVLPVPTLKEAYRALPDHCRLVLELQTSAKRRNL